MSEVGYTVKLEATGRRGNRETEKRREELKIQYDRFVDNTRRFFGEGNELAPGSVRKIVLRNQRRFSDISGDYGMWMDHTRTLTLYANNFDSRRQMQDTLGHELGHAYALQEARKRKYFGRKGSIVAGEAFAEWLRVINDCGGIKWQVNDEINKYLFSNYQHGLHNSISESPYPSDKQKLQDAAVFNYVYQEYGMDALINIYGSDATFLNNMKDKWGSAFGEGFDSRVPHVARNILGNFRERTGEKRLTMLDRKIQKVLGVSSTIELAEKARRWHLDDKYGKNSWRQ